MGLRGRSNPGRESRQALPPPVGGQEQRGARFQGMLATLCWAAGAAERATPCTLCQPRLRWRSNRARDFCRVLPAPIVGRNSGTRYFKPFAATLCWGAGAMARATPSKLRQPWLGVTGAAWRAIPSQLCSPWLGGRNGRARDSKHVCHLGHEGQEQQSARFHALLATAGWGARTTDRAIPYKLRIRKLGGKIDMACDCMQCLSPQAGRQEQQRAPLKASFATPGWGGAGTAGRAKPSHFVTWCWVAGEHSARLHVSFARCGCGQEQQGARFHASFATPGWRSGTTERAIPLHVATLWVVWVRRGNRASDSGHMVQALAGGGEARQGARLLVPHRGHSASGWRAARSCLVRKAIRIATKLVSYSAAAITASTIKQAKPMTILFPN